MCICVFLCMCVHMCVCVCVHVFVCMCLCVCVMAYVLQPPTEFKFSCPGNVHFVGLVCKLFSVLFVMLIDQIWYCFRYTKRNTTDGYNVYAILLALKSGPVILGAPQPSPETTVTMLGYHGTFHWEKNSQGMVVTIPSISVNELPCKWAWVLKITDVKN